MKVNGKAVPFDEPPLFQGLLHGYFLPSNCPVSRGTVLCLGKGDTVRTGNPAAEGTSYFFINKISKFQSFIVLRWKKCVKLANEVIKVTNKYNTRL